MRTTLLFVLFCLATATFPAQSADSAFLADKHNNKLNSCEACHAANPKDAEITDKTCTGCHGSMDKMGERSEGKFSVNPHAPHGVELSCLQCHHGHKPAEIYCNKCHDFEFKAK